MSNGSPILSVGEVNVKTGEFEHGEFYGFWGDDTCYEVHKTDEGNIEVVATAGTTPVIPIGKENDFIDNDSREFLFIGKVIETVVGDAGFKTLGEKYGNLLSVSTYK